MASWSSRWPVGSLRSHVRREVCKHLRENQALRQRGDSFLYTFLATVLRGRLLLGVVVAYILAPYSILILWPDADRLLPYWIKGLAATIADVRNDMRNANGYFLTIQVTLIAVIFPIAIALVSLMTQRTHTSSTNAHIRVYYTEALARPTGLSGIALVGVLAFQTLLPDLLTYWGQGTSADWLVCEVLLTGANLLWLSLNLVAIGHFLSVSLAFIDPAGRARIRERFTANRSLPYHFERHLFVARYHGAAHELLPELRGEEPIGLYFGAMANRMGAVEVARHVGEDHGLVDVYGRPLRLVLRRWLKRSRSLPEESSGGRRRHSNLAFPLEPFVLEHGDVPICRRRGADLSRLEHWIIRTAFRFGRVGSDETPEPKAILEELGDEVMGQIERNAAIGFEDALRAMLDYHRFLFEACITTDDSGAIWSLSEIGGFWGPTHEDWLNTYGRIIERAIAMLDREDDFFRYVVRVPAALMPPDLRRMPMAPVIGSFRLGRSVAAGLERWIARRQPDRSSAPAGPDRAIYRSALRAFVGPWLDLVQRTDYYFKWKDMNSSDEERWRDLISSWPFLWTHLWGSVWLLALALWNDDEDGLELYIELILRWPGHLRHDLDVTRMAEAMLITPGVFLSDSNLVRRMCQQTYMSVANIFADAVANAWEDMVWSMMGIALRWRLSNRPEAHITRSTITSLRAGESQNEDAPQRDWVHEHAFHRLFYSLIRPVIDSGRYAEKGYSNKLSDALSTIDGISDPGPFPASSWTPKNIHRRDDLRFAFDALLLMLIKDVRVEVPAGRIESQLEFIENCLAKPDLGDLAKLLDDIRSDLAKQKTLIEGYLTELGSETEYDTATRRLIGYLDLWINPIQQRREQRIRSAQVSDAKLNEVQRTVDNALMDIGDDLAPFQPAVRRTTEAVEHRKWKLCGITKANLIDGPMADPWSGLGEHIGNGVAAYSASLALRELLRDTRKVGAPTSETYQATLLEEAEKLREIGLTPMLLVRYRNNPGWFAELIDTSEMLTHRSLGKINGIEVVVSQLPQAGTSLLVAREALEEIVYEEDRSGRIVTLTFEPDEKDPWEGTIHAEFGQNVLLTDAEPVALAFDGVEGSES